MHVSADSTWQYGATVLEGPYRSKIYRLAPAGVGARQRAGRDSEVEAGREQLQALALHPNP